MLIDRIWAQQPGKYFCLSTKSGAGEWKDHFFTKRGDGDTNAFADIPEFLQRHRDKQIYFCPHGFSKPRRLKPYAVLPKLLWSDLDEADPRMLKFKPTVAIESSPGRYVGLWFTDDEVTEELNRRMSYLVGADKSGWDLTQVLRVPGTINWKYQSQPKVRILWTDGPTYAVHDLERKLPGDEDDDNASGEETDAAAVYKEYEKKLPHWVRRELLNGKPVPGKRSEMFWKLGQTLIECGLTTEDTFVLLKASPWNKFAGRRNEDKQLRREIDKAINKHVRGAAPKRAPRDDADEDDERRLVFRSMDEVEEEEIDWMWYPYIAFGELTILEGDPGLGKSYLMEIVAMHICDGLRLPREHKGDRPVKGKVLYFDLENSAATVTKKRLNWNGCKNLRSFVQCEEPFSIDDDAAVEEIYEYVERERPDLVVFDTLNTYLGKADAFKGHEAQQAFARFREMAQRLGCAVVVLRHLTKSTKERALYRGQGSIAFTGLARVVMTVGTAPDDTETRVLAVTKNNIAPFPRALTFRIDPLPPTIKDRHPSKFVWGEYCDYTADDIVAAPSKEKNTDTEDAVTFLKDALTDGAVEVNKVEKMAESRSIGKRALTRAADQLGIKKQTKGFGRDRRSFWSMPV